MSANIAKISVVCSGCNKALGVPPKYAGKKIKCPGCGASVLVLQQSAASSGVVAKKPVFPKKSADGAMQACPTQIGSGKRKIFIISGVAVFVLSAAAVMASFMFFSLPSAEKLKEQLVALNPGLKSVRVQYYKPVNINIERGYDSRIKIVTKRETPALKIYLFGSKVTDLTPLRGLPLDTLLIAVSPDEPQGRLAPDILHGINCKSLWLTGYGFSDWAVAGEIMRGTGIDRLNVERSNLSDLDCLKGLNLNTLMLSNVNISDLAPLYGMQLINLSLVNTESADLSPLKGMGIRTLTLDGDNVSDLTPLAAMPLSTLVLWNCPVTDISPLAKCSKLRTLNMDGIKATDFSFLKELSKLYSLSLCNIGLDELPELPREELTELDIAGNNISDLSLLKGLKLTSLNVIDNPVVDLQALEGMQLNIFSCSRTDVTDISVLKDMPLSHLSASGVKVTDFSPLKNKKFDYIDLSDTAFAHPGLFTMTNSFSLNIKNTPAEKKLK